MRRPVRSLNWVCTRAALICTILLFVHSAAVDAAHLEKIVDSIEKPIFLTAPADDDRLFIVQEDGRIQIIDGSGEMLPTPFLDVSSLIEYDGLFRGLFGLAFHPDYAANGYFFLDYTIPGGDVRVARFQVTADPNVADLSSVSPVITVPQPGQDHNGGYIAFGPSDGYLYVSLGDGGFGGDLHESSQDPSLLLGKLLRLDIDVSSGYVIPVDNPFVGVSGYREEIWAVGFRSPWGMSFDRETHDLWVADVGLNNWEEIDFQPASSTGGENYGWSLMEGTSCYTPPTGCDTGSLTYPVHEYPHGPGCSVNGGFVYRGTQVPELYGSYLFSDWCTSEVWSMKYDGENVTELINRADELGPPSGDSFTYLVGFGQDAAGEVYVIDWNWNGPDPGQIFKIVSDVTDTPSTDNASQVPSLQLSLPHPNPFTDQVQFQVVTREKGPLQVKVHNTSGRLVWSREVSVDPTGATTLEWDGRDSEGTRQAVGVYFMTVRSGESAATQRLQLVR